MSVNRKVETAPSALAGPAGAASTASTVAVAGREEGVGGIRQCYRRAMQPTKAVFARARPSAAADRGRDVGLVAGGVGKRPPRWRELVADHAATGG